MTVATTELQVKKPSIKWGHIFAGIYLYAYERERLLICAILVHSPLLASVGLFYDIKEMLTELYYRERVLTNVFTLAVTAAAIYGYVSFIFPTLEPFASLGCTLASYALTIAIPLLTKIIRAIGNHFDRTLNAGEDSRFINASDNLREQAKKTREFSLFGQDETYLDLVDQARNCSLTNSNN